MTKNIEAPGSAIDRFFTAMRDHDIDSLLETVLSEYEPKNKELGFVLNHEENKALQHLRKERFNTDPTRLVERYMELMAAADEEDLDTIHIRKWVYCRQARHYLKNNDAELAARSVACLSWENLRIIGLIDRLDDQLANVKNQIKTTNASATNRLRRAKRLNLVGYVLESEGFTAQSIGNQRNARTVVHDLVNIMLKKQGERTISRDQLNKDIRFLRKHIPEDIFQEK